MSAEERRAAIWRTLCSVRFVTAEDLSASYHVSIRTIYRDLQVMAIAYPIEPVRGRYGGGYQLCEWFLPQSRTLCEEEITLLHALMSVASADQIKVLNSILTKFAP